MSKTEIQEKLIEIGYRVPPGDNWKVSNVNEVQKSITDALEAWFQMATVKPKAFRLNLEEGKLYAILPYRDWETDRKSTRLNSSHSAKSRMPSSA